MISNLQVTSELDEFTENDLFNAIKHGNIKLVKNCLNNKIDINAIDNNNDTPLHIAIKNGQTKKIICLLLKNGANLNIKDRDGLNALHLAAHSGKLSLVEILLKHNATIDDFTDNPNRETALHLASRSGHLKVIKCLLAHGADINKKTGNECGLTALHHSSACEKTTKLLLEFGISVNSLDNLNNNALHKACTWGYKKTAQVLVDYKIDVNTVNSMNSTALDIIHSVIWRIKRRGWFVNPGSAPEETAMIIIKVLTLKILCEDYVNEVDLKLLNSEELRGLYYQCKREIEKMKKTFVCDECNVSIFDVLTRKKQNIAKIFNNEKVLKKLELLDFREEFSIYENELKICIIRAKEVCVLMKLCSTLLNSITRNILHTFIINEILSYLNEEDLKTFLKCFR